MMTELNAILASEAAREKGCTPQAIYNAIDRGSLNAVRMGRHWLVVRDKKWKAYEVQETGGRRHARYLADNEPTDQDDARNTP